MMSSKLLTNQVGSDPWWIDSGEISHMTSHKEYFHSLVAYGDQKKVIYTANDGECVIEGIGSIFITLSSSRKAKMENVLFIPSITKNLLSVSQMIDNGLGVEFIGDACLISKNGAIFEGEKTWKTLQT